MFFSLQRTVRVNCGCVQTERPALRDYSASPPGVLQTDNDEVLRGSSDEGSSAISAHLYLVSLIAIQTITESMQMNSIFQLIDNSEEKSRQPQRSHCLVSYLIKRNMLFWHLWKNISINQINVFPARYGDLHIISLCDINLALGTINRILHFRTRVC